MALAGLDDGLVQQALARPQRDAYRRRVAAGPVAAPLVEAAFQATYTADFITTPPYRGPRVAAALAYESSRVGYWAGGPGSGPPISVN